MLERLKDGEVKKRLTREIKEQQEQKEKEKESKDTEL